jgi:small Trp-rich protein
MWLLGLSVLLTLLKYFDVSVFARLSWWQVLIPYGLTLLWWWYADASGYTKVQAMAREQRRKDERLERQRSQFGMLGSRSNRRKRR